MSDSANTPPQPQGQLSEADERALDALLFEAFAPARQPRDFTAEILLRLEQQAVRLPQRDSGSPPERSGSVVWAATAAVAMLAASLLVMLLSSDPAKPPVDVAQQTTPGAINTPDGQPSNGASPAPAAGLATNPRANEPTESAIANKPPRRDPLILSHDRQLVTPSTSDQPSVTPPHEPAEADALAVQPLPSLPGSGASLAEFNQQFATYWQSVGVQPAPAIAYSRWQNRIAERFGWQPTAASEHEVIQNAFANSDASRALAERLVEQLIVGLKPSEERRQQLVDEATDVILSGERFDRWLSTWVTEDALVAQTPDGGPHAPILAGDWFASRIVGADVGCAKCHDSPIDSRYAQDDFWGLAALFSPAANEPLFYELPDGRQRVATPSVPVRWFGPSDAATQGSVPGSPEALASRNELARRVVGSPQVARTLANHLWTIGFGMPLVSATSSPLAPPHDDSLERALAMLSGRLMRENFDIRAAAQWVIASEPMKRDAPEVLGAQRWQDADEAKLAAASLAQRSFAAAKVTAPQANRSDLLAMMQSRSGLIPATLTAPDSLLAQPLLRSPQPPVQGATGAAMRQAVAPANSQPQVGQGELQDYWWSQWLADREALRGGWLNSIDNTDQQLLHAFYAAGYRDVDHEQLARVEKLLQATPASEQDRAETIAQIYWILQHSK